jgi:hypothetical protein
MSLNNAEPPAVRRREVTAFRSVLLTCGAAFGADFLVGALRSAAGPPQFALGWAVAAGVVVAVLAGTSAGIAIQTSKSTGWSLLLAALVALNAGTGAGGGVFSSASIACSCRGGRKGHRWLAHGRGIGGTAHPNAA